MSINVVTPERFSPDRVRLEHHNLPAREITQSVANMVLVWDRLRSDNPRIRWNELIGRGLEICHGRKLPWQENPSASIREGMSVAAVNAAMTNTINVKLVEGFRSVPNSTLGWSTETEILNFMPASAVTAYDSFRLEHSDRSPAGDATIGLLNESWGLARFSKQFILDETDLLNSPSVDLSLLMATELGKAAKRLVIDLAWAVLLANNPTAYDGLNLFSTEHLNYLTGGSSSLASGLDNGMSLLASAAAPSQDGFDIPVGAQPKYLIVPPASYAAALRQVRLMKQDNDRDLTVVVEPRIAAGVVHPTQERIVEGKAGGWLLASPASIAPSLLLGSLEGQGLTPVMRTFPLSGPTFAGQWGWGADVHLDVAACVVDWRSLVWSDGA